jgi:hypothetical protein
MMQQGFEHPTRMHSFQVGWKDRMLLWAIASFGIFSFPHVLTPHSTERRYGDLRGDEQALIV